MEFEPLHEEFGARVSGVDLTGPLSPQLLKELHKAIATTPCCYSLSKI